jgi:tRNA threonylcarbamoyladenosine biosynthesis protein TsaE
VPDRLLVTNGPRETERIGAELAASLGAGDIVLVSGELGAGKTTLVRGACRALGVQAVVSSPTFTIGQRYATPSGRPTVAHVDLYRVEDLAAEDPELLDDYLRPDTIAFVEWPPDSEGWLEGHGRVAFRVTLTHGGGERRTVEIR